jgi:hypothetical protein
VWGLMSAPPASLCRARGLLLQLRRRLLALCAERDTLRDQFGELPAEGDPNAVAISIAKVCGLGAPAASATELTTNN